MPRENNLSIIKNSPLETLSSAPGHGGWSQSPGLDPGTPHPLGAPVPSLAALTFSGSPASALCPDWLEPGTSGPEQGVVLKLLAQGSPVQRACWPDLGLPFLSLSISLSHFVTLRISLISGRFLQNDVCGACSPRTATAQVQRPPFALPQFPRAGPGAALARGRTVNSWAVGAVTPSCAQAWRLRPWLSHYRAGEIQGSVVLHSAQEPQEKRRLFKNREQPVWNTIVSGGLPNGQAHPGGQPLAPGAGDSLPAAWFTTALWLMPCPRALRFLPDGSGHRARHTAGLGRWSAVCAGPLDHEGQDKPAVMDPKPRCRAPTVRTLGPRLSAPWGPASRKNLGWSRTGARVIRGIYFIRSSICMIH